MSQYISQIPWWRTALVRSCLALLVGMSGAVFFPFPVSSLLIKNEPTGLQRHTFMMWHQVFWPVLLGLLWILAWAWLGWRKKWLLLQTPTALAWQGFFLLSMVAALGYVRYADAAAVRAPTTTITLTTAPVAKKKGWQARGEMAGGGGVWLYLSQDPQQTGLGWGVVVQLDQLPQRILAAKKTAFDFQRYAAAQGIYHQASLRPGHYQIMGKRPVPAHQKIVQRAAQWTLSVLQRQFPQRTDAGLAAALLMGHKQGLDPELVQAYRATGVLHVIAISGMHLSLLAAGLAWLLRPLLRLRYGKLLVFWLTLFFVWGFAALTGMGASVSRAALLLGFLALARLQYQRLSLAHATAGAATLLLLWQPLWLLDLGCQLSFAAVLGIGLLAGPIEKALPLSNPLLKAAWQVTAASLAAQLFTLPLLLYYFRQFPTLFWLGNLLAVPLSGLLLYLLCAVLLFSALPLSFLATATSTLASSLLQVLNAFLLHLSRLPFALWQTPAMGLGQVAALYVVLFTACWWQHKKQRDFSGTGL